MGTFGQDLRYAVRTLIKSPGFTVAAVATLALGIGANTAIFSVVNAVMVRPLPGVAQPDGLAWITHTERGRARRVSYPDFLDYRARRDAFSGVAAVDELSVHVAAAGEAERIAAQIAGGDYFSVLGVVPQLGRPFTAADEEARRPVVVLSDAYWRSRFSADPGAIGSSLVINGRSWTVVGVAPASFLGLDLEKFPQVYLPLATWLDTPAGRARMENRDSAWLRVISRLEPNVSKERASAVVASVARANAPRRAADLRDVAATAEAIRGWIPPGHSGEFLPVAAVGLVTTGLVLCIAAANFANLLLGRAAARRREIGIRLAIGASRGRIARQLLTESTLVAVLGGAGGVLVSSWSLGLLLSRLSPPAGLQPTTDGRVLLYAFSVSLVTGFVFGLAPAWRATRRDVLPALKDAGGRDAGSSNSRLQGSLVVVQMALSLVLLAVAGLFLRSLSKAAGQPIGLDRDNAANVLAVSFDLETQGYSPERSAVFASQLVARIQALPGVRSAALAQTLPLSGRAVGDTMAPEGTAPRDGEDGLVFSNTVSPGFFAALGIPLVKGRDFTPDDRQGSPRVAVVNELLARQFWPGGNAIGQRLRVGDRQPEAFEVIGVAGDGKYIGLTEAPRGFAYFPILQQGPRHGETILLASVAPGSALVPALKAAVRDLDPTLPLFHLQTLAQSLDEHSADRRQGTLLVAVFGALALLLAAVGLYGVVSHAVARRTREIGVRMALGASRRDVAALFVGRGARLALLGAAVGLVLAAGMTRLLSGMLFGVSATDASTFAFVVLLLTLVALAASWLPARRAARVDPMEALRHE